MPRHCEYLIVGGGIAGTCLAWALTERGVDVCLVDDRPAVSCSRIAAGLITPITGPRLAVAWRWDEFWPHAVAFYERLADRLAQPLLHPRRMVRLFASADEVRLFQERRKVDAASLIAPLDPHLPPPFQTPALGGFEMPIAGQLDVPAFLDTSWSRFTAAGQTCSSRLDPQSLRPSADRVAVPSLDLTAGHVLFAEGFPPTANPWFPGFPFRPAKGDILTLRIPHLGETRVVHGPVWLAPKGDGLFRCGSTYEWTVLDQQPTPSARESILNRLRTMLTAPVEVVDHHAAVRPALRRFHPVIARSPKCDRILSLNGLGSKGSLQAPFFADHLARHLIDGLPLDPALRLDLS